MSLAAAAYGKADPRHLTSKMLGAAAAVLLIVSLFFPYWQARLFAPQYRSGLTAVMYAYKITGDIQEIDELNHYVGVRKLDSLAVWERKMAIPAVVLMAVFCLIAFSKGCRLSRLILGIPATLFPAIFVADTAFWMSYASTHLDPTAPLKLRAFHIPVLGVGKVAQFHSEVGPVTGFYLAAAASLIMIAAFWIAWSRSGCPKQPLEKECLVRKQCPLREFAVLMLLLLVVSEARAASPSDIQTLIFKAPPGAEINIPSGIYFGPIVIDKTVTLRGEGRAVIDARGKGTVVTVRAPGVVLDGLTLRGSGDSLLFEDSGVRIEASSAAVRHCVLEDVLFGTFLVNASGAVIEDNRMRGKSLDIGRRGDLIRSWNSDRLTARRNVLEGGRDFVLWFSTGSQVVGNTITGSRYGLHFMYTDNAVVEGNRFIGNSVGLYVMYSQKVRISGNRFERHRGPSGSGLGLKESDWITVADNDFIGNRQAVYIDGSPLLAENTNTFTRNVFVRNDIGLSILPGVSGNVFYDNVFEDNLQQISRRGGGQLTGNDWEKNGRGNFWSDYVGYGTSGSEVGRIPYRSESAWEGLMDRRPLARFFMFTPAAEAVDLASRAFPVFRPKAVLTDERPLLRPPFDIRRSEIPAQASWSLPMGLASLSGFLLGFPAFLRRRRGKRPVFDREGREALTLNAVNKSFGDHPVLCGVDAKLAAGRTLVLWGPNGAGKSTLIKCLLGLYEFDGTISIFGHDVMREGRQARSCLGYVAQEFAGYDWTVRQAMEFVAALRGVERDKIVPSLERCGLSAQMEKRVCDLSGGMKQKLALAQALLADPPLLVLDEPCSNLDAASRKELLGILRGLKGGRAIIMTSHRFEEVMALADDVLWLEEGHASRLMSRTEFSQAAALRVPLWIELEHGDRRESAVSALKAQGYAASLNGVGLWVEADPGAMMAVVRALEREGFPVRDVRREAGV